MYNNFANLSNDNFFYNSYEECYCFKRSYLTDEFMQNIIDTFFNTLSLSHINNGNIDQDEIFNNLNIFFAKSLKSEYIFDAYKKENPMSILNSPLVLHTNGSEVLDFMMCLYFYKEKNNEYTFSDVLELDDEVYEFLTSPVNKDIWSEEFSNITRIIEKSYELRKYFDFAKNYINNSKQESKENKSFISKLFGN